MNRLRKGIIRKIDCVFKRVRTLSLVDKSEANFLTQVTSESLNICLDKCNNKNEKDCAVVRKRIVKLAERLFDINMSYVFVITVIPKLVNFI